MAFDSTNTTFAWPEDEGEFEIRGLKETTYSLFIDGINGYRETTIDNFMVRRSRETEPGIIHLSQ